MTSIDQPAPTLPKLAVVDLNDCTLTFDGARFPHYIRAEGIDIEGLGDRNELPTIRFGIFAENVEVIPKRETA